MNSFRRSQFLHLVVLPLMLVVFLSGCHKWVPIEPPYTALAGQPDVRATLTEGPPQFVPDARIARDSLIGIGHRERIALPIEQVRLLEKRLSNDEANAGLVVVGILVVIGAATQPFALD